jgi:putative CocE/NonD family hydrolase
MRDRDEPMHRYFAGHGYAAVRVDLRGTGDSDGVLLDEYLPQEIDDAREAIRWLAAQSWCTGAVGMMGKSWGGIRRPPGRGAWRVENLRAILTVCCSDDRFTDDAHFMGGSLLNENLFWGSLLTALRLMPPDPKVSGERWREMWLERLAAIHHDPATGETVRVRSRLHRERRARTHPNRGHRSGARRCRHGSLFHQGRRPPLCAGGDSPSRSIPAARLEHRNAGRRPHDGRRRQLPHGDRRRRLRGRRVFEKQFRSVVPRDFI